MLYYMHHPSGNVVIRTTNAYIVLQYQKTGWLTTPSFADVLAAHPEWANQATPRQDTPSLTPATTEIPPTGLVARILGIFSSTVALVTSFAGSRGRQIQALALAHSDDKARDTPSNSKPIHWLTAIERDAYHKYGLPPRCKPWITCTESDVGFEYCLEDGVWEGEEGGPGYDNDKV